MRHISVTRGGTATVTTSSTATALGTWASHLLGDDGKVRTILRRDQETKEVRGLAITEVRYPEQNMALLGARKVNPWVSLAEFPWLLAGRNDIAWLQRFLPKADQFSDDGRTWRAGYGPRLRRWGRGVDQLAAVVEALRRDPATRQAVISLWDPEAEEDYLWGSASTRDMPCTNRLQFMERDGALDLQVDMRSNDLIWGYSGVNMVNFTLLQQLVARLLGMPVGMYRHVAGSLHVYQRHYDMLRPLAQGLDPYAHSDHAMGMGLRQTDLADPRDGELSLGYATRAAEGAMQAVVDAPFAHGQPHSMTEWGTQMGMPLGTWWVAWAYFMGLHAHLDDGEMGEDGWASALAQVRAQDWRLAASAYVGRSLGYWVPLEEALQDNFLNIDMQDRLATEAGMGVAAR